MEQACAHTLELPHGTESKQNWLGLLLVKAILSSISKTCESQDHFKIHLQALERQLSSY